MSAHQTDQTAHLHQALLPHGLFPRLGARYMRRWHRTFVDSPFAVGFTARDDRGTVHGFLLGTTDQARYTQDVLVSHRFALGWRGALALAVRPRTLVHFVQSRVATYVRRMLQASRQAPASTRTSSIGVVHAIACSPGYQGHGVGRALLAAFEVEAMNSGTSLLQLVTREGEAAADFYRRLGWSQSDRRCDRDGNAILQFDRAPGAS